MGMPGRHQTNDSGYTLRERSRDQEVVSRELLTFLLMYLIFYENAFSHYLYNC